MHTTITVRHGDISAEMKEHARGLLAQYERRWPRVTGAHMIIQAEKRGYAVEVNVNAGTAPISVRARDPELRTALDQASEKAARRLEKLTARVWERRKRVLPAPAAPVELPGDVPRLIREENFEIKTISGREACLHLRASSLAFLVYRDAETKKISIIYHKHDGNLGLIEL